MIKERQEILQELGKTNYGIALKEYLNESITDMSDLSKLESWDETLGKKYAVEIIKKLFSFMETKESQQKSKTKYY